MDKEARPKKEDRRFDAHRNIHLRLSDYDEIFSVFDPRPHAERALSVDFVEEAKRASIDKPTGQLEVRLLVPARLRNLKEESVIKRRLRNHFNRHMKILRGKRGKQIRGGEIFVACGLLIMFVTTFILFNYSDRSLFTNFLIVVFEPAGWFLFWEGLDQIVFESKKVLPELEFNEKMADAHINFQSC